MPVNDKILTSDYNNLRAKATLLLGSGSADRGYGQTVQATDRTVSDRVTINEWGRLRFDIINAYTHIFGTTPTIVNVPEAQRIRYSTTFTPETTGLIDAPVTQYDQWLTTVENNRFTVHPSQSSTFTWASSSTSWPGPFGATWNTKIEATVTVGFPSAAEARHFFNSGGQIRFASSQSGGSGTAQVLAWRSLLSDTGMRSFGGNNPGTGTSPANGQNWYRLSSSYNVWSTVSASTPYGANSWRISARTGIESNGSRVVSNSTGTATVAEFLVEWIDSYVDPGQYPENPQPDTIDEVNGTFSLSVSHLFATGILQPPGTGNFTVTQPTIAVGQISGS